MTLYSSRVLSGLGKLRVPLAVVWSLTYRCNQRCLYCEIWKCRRRELRTAEACRIIEEMGSLGTKVICFSGGEPLLRRDLGTLIVRARDAGIPSIDINSNGSLVRERIAELEGIRLLCLTLNGPSRVHDAHMGKGSFRKVMEAARAAKARGIRVYFRMVLTRLNFGYVGDVLELARPLGIKVIVQPVTSSVYGTCRPHNLSVGEKELRETFRWLLTRKRAGDEAVSSPVQVLEHCASMSSRRIHCVSERIFFHMGPDGSFFPCAWERDLDSVERRNALTLGVGKAIAGLPMRSCSGCTNTSSLEFIYSLSRVFPRKGKHWGGTA